MRIIIVKNSQKKLAILIVLILFWLCMILLSDILFKSKLIMSFKVADYFSFSYPSAFKIDSFFINHGLKDSAVAASTQLLNSKTQKFNDYKSLNGNFSFKYPSYFTLNQKNFEGSEILYHLDFSNSNGKSHGFVEVWNLTQSLDSFLENSKSTSQLNYKYFNSEKININNIPGYFWDYSVLGNNGQYYKGSEVFMQKDGKMYRISYFMPESLWTKDESDIFWSMVNSFKVL